MKQLLIINIHSFIDVITNSSSELFVMRTKKTVEEIEKILRMQVDVFNEVAEDDYHKGWSYEKMFKVSSINDSNCKQIISYMTEYGSNSFPFICGKKKVPKYEQYKDWNLYEKAKDVWYKKNKKELLKIYEGQIIIESVDDNSIPYSIMEWIANTFNAERYHLG